MKRVRRPLPTSLAALTCTLMAGLVGCGGEPDSTAPGQIGGDEAQALAEAKSMLEEQRMPSPSAAGEEATEESDSAPNAPVSQRP